MRTSRRALAAAMMLACVPTASRAATASVPHHRIVIGHSVRGRALRATEIGAPNAPHAVRLAPHANHRFDVHYEGAFFESGIAGPFRNGELCIPPLADDPLEAINVRVMRRAGQ